MHITSLPLPARVLSPAATGLLAPLALTLIATLHGPETATWTSALFLAAQTVALLTLAAPALNVRVAAPLLAATTLLALTTSALILPLAILGHAFWALLHQSQRFTAYLPRGYLYFTLTANLTLATVLTFTLHFTQ
ncbi:hypothetical protein [Donghicola mangrovi]|uniref:Uncharacterized protein n=1 Tax=Donghicola mangrovi TaxID=2729614 RepID=A0A850Q1B1_9RHOB|nr:hypothetical protein [Donghicola mangrovi]NVO22774.1 hypothetical protein [Donghicola mangrovi]